VSECVCVNVSSRPRLRPRLRPGGPRGGGGPETEDELGDKGRGSVEALGYG